MKKLFPLLLIFLFALSSNAQDFDQNGKVKWYFTVKAVGENEADLVMSAKLFDHYHIYSKAHDPEKADGTGTPTAFNFAPNSSYKLVGSIREPKPFKQISPIGTELFHNTDVKFKQRIKITDTKNFTIEMKFSFQICNENGCLQPMYDEPFTFNINPKDLAKSSASKTETKDPKDPKEETKDTSTAKVDTPLEIVDGVCPEPMEDTSHVVWAYKSYLLSENEYEMVITARLDSGWNLIEKDAKGFLQGLNIQFTKNELYELVGEIKKGEIKSGTDDVFKRSLEFYSDRVEFRQKIKLKTDSIPVIGGEITFTTINHKYISVPEIAEIRVDLNKSRISEDAAQIPSSLLAIFVLGFLGGLAALLTPCVFPMIPMTVSFFTKQSKTRAQGIRNALIYSISIIAIYIILGLGVTMIFGAGALNALSTNVYFNIAFFILLVVFGASFLGAFEIKLPSSWINKADKNADKGGLIGIFFMAFTLALVSFSCTGPIIGTLLVESVDNGIMGPFWGMFGFSLALALPFGLFSAFPGWLNTMPQSGGWLNSVKVILGFLEIALAFKFLSNADLVVQAEFLTREVFLSFWIVIFGMMGFYLLGKLKLPHDSDLPHISIPRLSFAIVIFSFVIYMLPGMWGAPVKLLSGFLPPQTEQYSENPYGVGGQSPDYEMPKGAHPGPGGIPLFNDYNEALAYAIEIKKPLMLDFTGLACINCRKMEEQVWKTPDVTKILVEKFVIVSLYVDEQTELPEDEKYTTEEGKEIINKGDRWMDLEDRKYGQVTQPLYVIIDHEEEMIGGTMSFDTDADLVGRFKAWLEKGATEYKERINEYSVRSASYKLVKSCYTNKVPNYEAIQLSIFGEEEE